MEPSAQTTGALRPVDESRFEVISIKPLPRGSNIAGYLPDLARFIANGDVAQLLFLAYQVPPYRIVDMPEWTRTERYVINATITAPRQPGDLAAMVRHMEA